MSGTYCKPLINNVENPSDERQEKRKNLALRPSLPLYLRSVHSLTFNEYWLGHICHALCTLCCLVRVCVFISEYWCMRVCVCQICGSCQLVSPQDEHSTSHLQDPLTPAFSPGTNNTSLDLVRGGYMVLMFNKQHAELGLPGRTLGVITSYPSYAGLGREDATHDW